VKQPTNTPPANPIDAGSDDSAGPVRGDMNFELHTTNLGWGNIDLLQISILNCLTTIFQNSDYCQLVSMIARELLENALKYGDWGKPTDSTLSLHVFCSNNGVDVEVENPVANHQNLDRLTARLKWIKTFPSAQEAFFSRMLQIAEFQNQGRESGLGLVRIAYEGRCELHMSCEDSRHVKVRAHVPQSLV
jgi:hypothetical protein